MRMISRKLLSYMLAGTLTVASSGVPMVASASSDPYGGFDELKPTGGEMLADAFMVRPIMLVGTVLTTATFIVTLPFSALGGNVGEAANTLVVEPAAYTFARPLGEM